MSTGKCSNSSCNNNSVTSEPFPTPSLSLGLMLQFALIFVVLGNLLVLLALRSYKRWTSPDVLVCSLSTADLLDSLIGLQTLTIMNYFLGAPWVRWICEMYLTLLYTFRLASVTTVTCMAAERALLVVYPIKHHTMVTALRTKKVTLAIWLFCLILSVLPLLGFGHSGYRPKIQKCFVQLYDFGYSYAVFIEVYGLVLSILTLGSYVLIKLSTKRFIRRQVSLGASRYKRQIGTEKTPGKLERTMTGGISAVQRLNRMMAIVVIVYYISWLPFLFNNLASLITDKEPSNKISAIAGLMSLLHALVNPVLYGKMSQRYRRGYMLVFKTMLMLCGGERPISLNKESQTVPVRTQQKHDSRHAAKNSFYDNRICSESITTPECTELNSKEKKTDIIDHEERTLQADVKEIIDHIIADVIKKLEKNRNT